MKQHIIDHIATMTSINTKDVCKRFGVTEVIRNEHITKERKAELFLLGAVLSREEINNNLCDIMIYDQKLYILSVKNIWLNLSKR